MFSIFLFILSYQNIGNYLFGTEQEELHSNL